MRYQTKLYLSLICISFVSSFFAIVIVYKETKIKLFNELRSKGISVVATAASFIDGDRVKTIAVDQNSKTPDFEYLKNVLRKVRNVNRRDDTYIQYVYAIAPSPSDPTQLIFIGDADEDPEYVGEIYTYSDASSILLNRKEAFANTTFNYDQWGFWLSSFAPILDKEGRYVATIGIDVNAKIINAKLDRLINYGEISLGASILLAIIVALFLSRFATRSLAAICKTVNEIGGGNLNSEIHLHTGDEFQDLSEAINEMSKGLQERERLKLSFARYVSHHILEKVLKTEIPSRFEGERKKITVLFTDIRQFSQLTEKLAPEEVVSLLNEYFGKMFEIILSNHGTLDKFIADSIMVEFGAPLEDSLQERHAIETAIKMQKELKILCDQWEKEGKPRIEMGIGIHTGLAVVGNIGSEKRMEYTAIGDTVNVASRLEHATKVLRKPILVSQSTIQNVLDQFKNESLGPITLPGREEVINVYSIEIE